MAYNIDLQSIADSLEFDLEDIEMLIEAFLEGAEESLVEIESAIEKNDFVEIAKAAHGIKGSALNLTLEDIAEVAKEIELAGKEEATIDYKAKLEELKILVGKITA